MRRKLTTHLKTSATRVPSLLSVVAKFTTRHTSFVAVVLLVHSTVSNKANAAASRATIPATTSAMPTRSTRSVAAMPTIPSHLSVATTWWRPEVVMAAMPGAVTTVHTTRALSSVMAAKCTGNADFCRTTPSRTFAVPNVWFPRLVAATVRVVSDEVTTPANTSAMQTRSSPCAARRVTTPLGKSVVIL